MINHLEGVQLLNVKAVIAQSFERFVITINENKNESQHIVETTFVNWIQLLFFLLWQTTPAFTVRISFFLVLYRCNSNPDRMQTIWD
jgi:hypothetical protein